MALTACSDEDDDDDGSSKKKKSKDSSFSSSSVVDDSVSISIDDGAAEGDSSSIEDVIPGKVTAPAADSDGDDTTTTTTTTAATDEPIVTQAPDSSQPDDTTTTTTTTSSSSSGGVTTASSEHSKPVTDFFDALQTGDEAKLEKALPPQMVKAMKDEGEWEEVSKEFSENLKKEYGNDYKIVLEVKGEKKLDDKDLKKYKDKYKDYMSIDINLTEGYYISVYATIKGSKDSDEDEDDIAVGLIDGNWYILDLL